MCTPKYYLMKKTYRSLLFGLALADLPIIGDGEDTMMSIS